MCEILKILWKYTVLHCLLLNGLKMRNCQRCTAHDVRSSLFRWCLGDVTCPVPVPVGVGDGGTSLVPVLVGVGGWGVPVWCQFWWGTCPVQVLWGPPVQPQV